MNWFTRYLARNKLENPVVRCDECEDVHPNIKRLREIFETIEFSPVSEDNHVYEVQTLYGEARAEILKNSLSCGISYTTAIPKTLVPFHEHKFEVEHLIVVDGELHIEIEVDGETRHYRISRNGYFKICPGMKHRLWTTEENGVSCVVILVPGSEHWPGYGEEDD